MSHRDLDALLGVLRETYANADPDRFASGVTPALMRLVAADRASYTECGLDKKFESFLVPGGALVGRLSETLARYGHQNPILSHYRRTGRMPVATFSDFVSRHQLHRLALYNEYYRQSEIEAQAIVPLTLRASERVREIGFALNRRTRDFSARDRLVLELLQPHLIQAHRTACAIGGQRKRLALLDQALETFADGVILLDEANGVRFASRRARQRLREYFDTTGRETNTLPETLARWVRHQTDVLGGDGDVPRPRALAPLVIMRSDRRLTVRLVGADPDRRLVLEERWLRVDPARLCHLGLTPREREVLSWVVMGKTNEETAVILSMRPATVAKHLEHVYRKLGVENRTAAIVHVLSSVDA